MRQPHAVARSAARWPAVAARPLLAAAPGDPWRRAYIYAFMRCSRFFSAFFGFSLCFLCSFHSSFSLMEPYFSHSMHLWTRDLKKVERINLARYGISGMFVMRGVRIDWDFMNACLRFWDPEVHVFRFGASLEELCPTFEEFSVILGSSVDAVLATPAVRVGYFYSFQRLFGLSQEVADAMVLDGRVNLTALIEEFGESRDFEDLERQRVREKVLIFCLVSGCLFLEEESGWGDIRLVELVHQMENRETIAGMVLAETLLSLDRAYRAEGRWSVSPIVLQIWLRDHLRIVGPPTRLPYSVELYRSRPILIRRSSEIAWASWLLELGSEDFLWYCPWYGIRSFITMNSGYRHVYLLGVSMTTFYQATRVMRQMGCPQGIPRDGPTFPSSLITAETKKAVITSWARAFYSVRPEGRSDLEDGYRMWLATSVWSMEKRRRFELIEEIEHDLTEPFGAD